jgi:hypothetical protein
VIANSVTPRRRWRLSTKTQVIRVVRVRGLGGVVFLAVVDGGQLGRAAVLSPRDGLFAVRNRQRFDLTPAGGDQGAEVDRLVSLGAARLEVGDDEAVVPADPDGNEFCVRAT